MSLDKHENSAESSQITRTVVTDSGRVVKVKPARCFRCGYQDKRKRLNCVYCKSSEEDPDKSKYIKLQANFITEMLRGAMYFPRGFVLLVSTPRLWATAAIPTILNFVCFFFSLFAAFYFKDYLANEIEVRITDWHYVLQAMTRAFVWVLMLLQFLIIPLITAWLFSIFGKILFMPFMEILSAQTEKVVLTDVVDEELSWGQIFHDLVMSLINAVGLVAAQLCCFLLLLPLHLIPVLGAIAWFVLPGVLFASMDMTDLNFVRRRYGLKERFIVWWQRKYRFFGFGMAFFFFLTAPILNILTGTFVIPIACVGGTLLFLELDEKMPSKRRLLEM